MGVYADLGRSGTDLNRPEYVRMMEDSGCWDVLAVWKIDRIHRNAMNFAAMMDDLRAADKEFVTVYEELDSTTVYGSFAMDILARLAQLESEQLGERVLLGMAQKVRKGEYIGPAPYGYRKNGKGALEPSPEASRVQAAYVRRYKGESFENIAYWLNLSAEDGRTWSRESVRRMIRNPVYAGYVSWNGIVSEGVHRPIISKDLWEAINEDTIILTDGLKYDRR